MLGGLTALISEKDLLGVLAATIFLSALSAGSVAYAAVKMCKAPLTQRDAVALQTRLLDAMSREDKSAFYHITAGDLILHERGKVYDRDGLLAIAAGAHRAGTTIVWRVTDPHVTSDCGVAVMSYVNSGFIQSRGQDAVPVRWLETAAYRKEEGNWRVFLLTSERLAGMENIVASKGSAAMSAAPAP